MRTYPIPLNEAARLDALDRLNALDSAPEPAFDHAAAIARQLFEAPTAVVTLIHSTRQWFKARCGLDVAEIPRDQSICAHMIMEDAPLVLADALADPRFAEHPAVAGPPHVRFYVGVPLILSSGLRIGSVCVLDYVAREAPAPEPVQALERLAGMVVALLEGGAAEGRRVAAGPGADLARARSEFLSLVSHELRTPLNGMLGLGSILKTRLAGEPERELLDGMLASAEHLRDLVERILHFSDAETGEFRLDEAEVALGEVMEQALRRNGAVARTTGKRLRLERSPAMAAVLRIDLAQIAVALDCVIANALAHGGSDVAVEAALSDEGEALLAVSDDGPGLFEASGDVAFPPFEIGGPVMTRGVGGLGLGLPLARRLVELHAGDLQLDRSRGRTRARIRLPRTRVGGA